MTGFQSQNAIALIMGIGAALTTYYLLPDINWITLAVISLGGYIGGHIPNIQQPSSPSYHIVRTMSALAAILIPGILYMYRPTDLLVAWIATYLLYHGAWWIIDRISLHRDYTHSITAIVTLPLAITACAYATVGQDAVLPVFIASSVSYIVQLLLEQRKHSAHAPGI